MRPAARGMPTSLSSSARALLGLPTGHLLVGADHLHDLPAHAVGRVQAGQRVLEDHPDLDAADRPEPPRSCADEVDAVEQRATRDLGAAGEPGDRLRRDALAGAGLTDDGQGLPRSTWKESPRTAWTTPSSVLKRHVQVTHLQEGHGVL